MKKMKEFIFTAVVNIFSHRHSRSKTRNINKYITFVSKIKYFNTTKQRIYGKFHNLRFYSQFSITNTNNNQTSKLADILASPKLSSNMKVVKKTPHIFPFQD